MKNPVIWSRPAVGQARLEETAADGINAAERVTASNSARRALFGGAHGRCSRRSDPRPPPERHVGRRLRAQVSSDLCASCAIRPVSEDGRALGHDLCGYRHDAQLYVITACAIRTPAPGGHH